MRILITGGCGFIGAWIIRRIFEPTAVSEASHTRTGGDEHKVVVFDIAHNTARWSMILSPEQISAIEFISGRVDGDEFVKTIVDVAPDAIIHLAGLQVPTCRDDPVLGARVNVIGSLNVFEGAKRLKAAGKPVPRIVYASSAAVFGPDAEYADPSSGATTTVSDTAAPKPSSHYGAFKLCVEHAARAYWLANGIASVGLRPLTVYGPGRDVGLTSFPTRAVAAAVLGKPFEIPFSGPTAYIHVREVADMFVTAAASPISDAKVRVPRIRRNFRGNTPKRASASRLPAHVALALQFVRMLTTGVQVYTVGGDTVDTKEFVRVLDQLLPGASAVISVTGGSLPIASRLDDSALRADYPTLARIPLRQGLYETLEVFRQLHAAGRLTV